MLWFNYVLSEHILFLRMFWFCKKLTWSADLLLHALGVSNKVIDMRVIMTLDILDVTQHPPQNLQHQDMFCWLSSLVARFFSQESYKMGVSFVTAASARVHRYFKVLASFSI